MRSTLTTTIVHIQSVAEIIKCFGDKKTGWGLAYWFEGINSFLDDRKPKDLLAIDSKNVIAAARDDLRESSAGTTVPSRLSQTALKTAATSF